MKQVVLGTPIEVVLLKESELVLYYCSLPLINYVDWCIVKCIFNLPVQSQNVYEE